MGAGILILGLGALGIGLLALGGKKERAPAAPTPGTTGEPIDWQRWVTDQVMQAAQSGNASAVDAAADLIESNISQMPSELQSYARQAVTALRAQAASLRVDTGAGVPPFVPEVPQYTSPVSTAEPQPQPPSPEPATGQVDWQKWIESRVVQAATSGVPATAERLANEIEAQIPSMPSTYQGTARQAVDAIRDMAASWQAPAPSGEVPPPPPPPTYSAPEPDPVISARARLADEMTTMLKQNGGAPNNRYKEDRALVEQYQYQEGLTADGMYGVGTGLSVVKYGIVPARPYYFSSNTSKTAADKEEWKRVMLQMASSDPARAAEWRYAANVASL